jgi:Protein of unknown function (DUF2953)
MLAVAPTIVVLLALLVALLAVPVVLVIDAERADTLEATWRVRWLFGLVDVRSSQRRPARPSSEPSGDAPRARESASGRRRGARMGIAALRTPGVLRQVARLASALFRQTKLDELQLRAAFGFDDPADTGVVYGFLSPLLAIAATRRLNVDCRPMFLESGLRGVLNATVHVRPLSVVGALVAFLLSPPVIRAMGSAWQARK